MNTKKNLRLGDVTFTYFDLESLGKEKIQKLPYSLRILLENLLRNLDSGIADEAMVKELLKNSDRSKINSYDIPFFPARVLMQDFTGVPAVVDLAAMRTAVHELGGDPEIINPLVPVDLVIDHSVQIDFSGMPGSLEKNVEKEYERNGERYALLKWAQKSFKNFRVVPPNSGICHQVNLEFLGSVVRIEEETKVLYPDTVVGTDSHTTMINSLGILGWGVGGIEAEAVMLGQAYSMPIPDVIGVRFEGKLSPGVTASDLVLALTELLRKFGVVEKFVEFFGPGLSSLTLPDRATIANMSPEYGATMGYFPVDEVTLEFLKFTGRDKEALLASAYCRANMLFVEGPEPEYRHVINFDLSQVRPSLAGPLRPQDRILLSETKTALGKVMPEKPRSVDIEIDGKTVSLTEGMVVIASITSCTNTSNPAVMIASGILAKKAWEKGLRIPSWVKTSLAPGSRVVEEYLEKSGLLSFLKNQNFHIDAFGCTTCIGNSGPLHPAIEKAQTEMGLVLSAVLSGNRNFEGRINPNVKASFLTSPPLVVAYALTGTINIDLDSEPIGNIKNVPIYLKDIWPTDEEIQTVIRQFVTRETYIKKYKTIFDGDAFWKNLPAPSGKIYKWDEKSTYIRHPPYFEGFSKTVPGFPEKIEARCLLLLGDSITTDHISPAGNIRADYPAGTYLQSLGVRPTDFNSYGARRGNHEVMIRGTFANIRIKNKMVAPQEGSWTMKYPEGQKMFVYEACQVYKKEKIDLMIIGGKEYGTGSSRDWAAKGTQLLGVQAIVTESYERIHRSNLVGMGVLPLSFLEGQNAEKLGLTGSETFMIHGLEAITPGTLLTVEAKNDKGQIRSFQVKCRLQSEAEIQYFQNRGILPYVLRVLLSSASSLG